MLVTFTADLRAAQTGDAPLTHDGTVLEVLKGALKVVLPQEGADALELRSDGSNLRVDRSLKDVTSRRQHAAIASLSKTAFENVHEVGAAGTGRKGGAEGGWRAAH